MNVNQIIILFTHQELTKIEGTPTYSQIAIMQQELNANTVVVLTTLGSGRHGLLGLMLLTEAYKAHTTADWPPP